MYKIFTASVISTVALVGCSSQSGPFPAPTVTVTQQAPESTPAPELSNSESYIQFVKSKGGYYASIASESTLINLGNIVCDGYESGLSQDDVVNALSYALVENNMDNQDGAVFAAAIVVGAETYLCVGQEV